MATAINKLLLIALLVYPYQIFSMDNTAQGISVSVVIVGGISVAVISGATTMFATSKYNKYALEREKLKLDYEEKRKKELAEQAEKEHKHQEENRILQAQKLLLNIQKTYVDEFKHLKEEKLQVDNLLTIIKENSGMKDMPLNDYHAQLIKNLEDLKQAEDILPVENQQEQLMIVGELKRILKTYNSQIADAAKQEKKEAKNRHKHEESEKRKLTKELLEIEKLQLEVDTIKNNSEELDHINKKLDTINTKITSLSTQETEHTSDIINSLYSLSDTIIQKEQESKQIINKNQEKTEHYLGELFKLIDRVHQYVINLVAQQQKQSYQSQPPQTPEYSQQTLEPMTGSSAPSMSSVGN